MWLGMPISLEEVVVAIEHFVMLPMITSINNDEQRRWSWAPGGPWVAKNTNEQRED